MVLLLQMADAVKAAEAKLGPIDCLVPNAGIASGGTHITAVSKREILCHRYIRQDNCCPDLVQVLRTQHGCLHILIYIVNASCG